MTVKAKASISVSWLDGISSIRRYYSLADSSTAPSKPTTSTPGAPWSDTEPTIDSSNIAKYLYFVDRTVFSNASVSYSSVSLSTSFEAAKVAYNKALDAAKTATNYMHFDATNGLIINNDAEHYDTGSNVQITSEGVNIRNGTEIAAKYGKAIQMFTDHRLALSVSPKDAIVKSFYETAEGKEPIIGISIGGSPNGKVDFSNLYYLEPGSHTAGDIAASALFAMIYITNGEYADIGCLKRVEGYDEDSTDGFWKSGEERYVDLWFFNGSESKAITMKVTSPGNVTPTEIKYDFVNTHTVSVRAFDFNSGPMGDYVISECEFVRVDKNSVCNMDVDGEIDINSNSDSAIVIHNSDDESDDDELHISKNSIHNKNGLLMFNYEDNPNIFALSKDGNVIISSSLDGTTNKHTPYISVVRSYDDETYIGTEITPESIDCPGRITSYMPFKNIKYGTTGETIAEVNFGITTSSETNVNRGIYDIHNSRWLFYADATDIYLGAPNQTSKPTGYIKPYYTKGDSITVHATHGGIVTNNKTIYLSVPLSKPLARTGTVSLSASNSTNGGIRVRQNGAYRVGDADNLATSGYSITATLYTDFIQLKFTFTSAISNIITQDVCGVTWIGTITIR